MGGAGGAFARILCVRQNMAIVAALLGSAFYINGCTAYTTQEDLHMEQCEVTCKKYHVVPGVSPGCVDLDMWIAKCRDARLTPSCLRPVPTFLAVNQTSEDLDSVCSKVFENRKLVIFSSVHKPYAFFDLLVESVVRQGLHVVVVGWDTTPESKRDGMHQVRYFGFKVVAIAYLLEKCTRFIADDQVVMFVDGADAFFQRGQNYILERFEQARTPIMFSTEETMMPSTDFSKRNYATKYDRQELRFVQRCPYKYLNSGGWIARAAPMRRWMREWVNSPIVSFDATTMTPLNPQPKREVRPVEEIWEGRLATDVSALPHIYKSNDQWHAAHLFQADLERATLDYNNSIFLSMHLSKPFENHINIDFTKHLVHTVFTKNTPAVIHYNGAAKWWHCAEYDPMKVGGFVNTTPVSQSTLDKHFTVLDTNMNLVQISAYAVARAKPSEIKCEGVCR